MQHQVPVRAAPVVLGTGPRRGGLIGGLKHLSRRKPTMVAGMAVIFVMALIAVFANLLFTVDPNKLAVVDRLQSPSSAYWFGTDLVGRDIYSRTIFGSRVSLMVGFSVALISSVLGAAIGLLAGYYSRVDAVVMRVMDGIMAIPVIILALALVALIGGSVQIVIMVLPVAYTPAVTRVVRASVLSLRNEVYVDAALALGASPLRIITAHILPNTLVPLIVLASLVAADAVLVEAVLSFLGAGAPPDTPSWGGIMAEGSKNIKGAAWVILFPGAFLTLTVLGINLAGDGLRDILDPKLRRTI